MDKKELGERLDALIRKSAETDMKIKKLQKWSEEVSKNEWISVVCWNGRWIGKREDGTYISTRGENGNWVWKPATEEEIEQFNSISSNPEAEP